MNDIPETVRERVTPILTDMGYELVECRFQKEYGTDTLTLFVYKKGGVELSDCEKITEAIDPVLDEMDIGDGPYNFNVSSPGLDRPIVTDDDYRRNVGEDVEIVFSVPLGKKKSAHGILTEYDENSFVLLTKQGKTEVFEKQSAEVVRPYIHF